MLSELECFFLLNNERLLNKVGGKKGTLGETGPLTANHPACEMEQPLGENYAVKSYYSNLTNELYSFIYNTNGIHYIQRINGNGICEVVYHGECLKLSAKPEHEITQFRAYLQVDKLCANRHGKSLIWTNGDGPIGQIDTEASIATNFFTTPFFERCADPCNFIQMCVPDPCGCLKGDFIPLDPNDAGMKNDIVDVGIKVSYIHYYYDGRRSIFAEPSTLFFQDTKGCFDNPDGFPRCIKLRVPVGNPLVEKIGIAFWKNGAWYMTEIVEKYKKYNNAQQYWYERELSEIVSATFDEDDCSFDYIFCNDKQCDTIDPKEFSRVFNPMPIKPQGILPIGIGEDKTALGFYNYEQGSCPIDKSETEKMDVEIDCPNINCNPEYTTIKVQLIIHNHIHGRNQFIWRKGGLVDNAPDDPDDTAYFGGLNKALAGGLEDGYDQFFVEDTRNFIVYIEGTETWAEMKQWKSKRFYTGREFWGTVSNMDSVQTRDRWRRATRNGDFFYQEAELKVIKGTRGFIRVASHKMTEGFTSGSQATSTFVRGTQNLFLYKGDQGSEEGFNPDVEEIYFDSCDKDTLDFSEKAFKVDDNAYDDAIQPKSSAFHGYVTDKNGRPVEGARIEGWGVSAGGKFVVFTDHNGFYHFYTYPGDVDPTQIDILVERVCASPFTLILTEFALGARGTNTRFDINITDDIYIKTSYADVKILVQDCNGHPVGGVRVALSGSKYDVTDGQGYATFKIRNYEYGTASNHLGTRFLRAVVMNFAGCFATDCNNVCNPCMPLRQYETAPIGCFVRVPPDAQPLITLPGATINRSYSLLQSRGLKAGGRYPFGFVARGDCGQISAVNEIKYLDIPRTQDKNKEGFCSFTYDTTMGGTTIMKLPDWVKCVDIVRGENLNSYILQFVVDKIERKEGKMILTIQSLIDYNERFFFKTNTVYQWVKNDRVEFIKNGDGKILATAQHGLLNYLTLSPFHDEVISGDKEAPVEFFNQLIIMDDNKLDVITEGAVIEIQRAKECTTDPTYFGICVSIPVIQVDNGDGTTHGELLYPVGTFDTFDTYFVKRIFGKLPSQQFEHKWPSDFWGHFGDGITGLDDTGRAYFINKFENKRRFGRNITINAPNVFNYFGDLVRTLENDGHGDLIALGLTDNQIMAAISEHDNSLHQVGNDFLKIGGDGIVRAVEADRIISEGEPKLSGVFGCQYPHIGSIIFGDGWISWVDVNKHTHVEHDYQTARAADLNKAQTYFRTRCQELETFNRANADPLDQLRFATGLNYHTGALHITIKALRNSGIYNEIKPFQKPNDTIMYHPVAKDYLGFASFTPEAYGQLNLFDGKGSAFVSFLNGLPYIHPIIPEKWDEFYSVAVDRIVGISMNKFPEKIKQPLSFEIQDETMWFVVDVSIQNPNFTSLVPPVRVKKDSKKWNGSFLNDINSRGGLYNGKPAADYYVGVTFCRDNSDSLKFNTTNDAKRVAYDSLDMIIMKFKIQEQSGMTANV